MDALRRQPRGWEGPRQLNAGQAFVEVKQVAAIFLPVIDYQIELSAGKLELTDLVPPAQRFCGLQQNDVLQHPAWDFLQRPVCDFPVFLFTQRA